MYSHRSSLTVLDLSNIAVVPESGGRRAEWRRVEAVIQEWRSTIDADAAFYGVADRSLRHKIDRLGLERLREWQRAGVAQVPPWADPIICEVVGENRGSVIVSNDRFRGLRRDFPFLQGFDRIYGFVISDDGAASLVQRTLEVLRESEISQAEEREAMTPRRLNQGNGTDLLKYEWACDNSECNWSALPAIEDLPINDHGVARCPDCQALLREAGRVNATREVKIVVNSAVVERVPVTVGTSIIFGRQSGRSAFDIASLVGEPAGSRISREHVQISNKNGRIRVRDLGSTNGSRLRRADESEVAIAPGRTFLLREGETVVLPAQVDITVSGKQYPRGIWLGREVTNEAPSDTSTVADDA